jgi:hypothetical protein
MNVVVGAGMCAGLLLLCAVVLIWKMMSSIRVRSVDPEWLKNFSVSSYRPMERLLDEDDITFLKEHSGYEPGMEDRLRSDRLRVFRMYLKNLGRDFNRLHYALRLIVLHATEDSPELAKTLIKQKLVFLMSFAAVHVRLELYRYGISGVDVHGLISTLDTMQHELQSMMSPPAMSASAA